MVRFLLFSFLSLMPLSLLGCSSTPEEGAGREETISRDAFMEAYMELRVVGLSVGGREMTLSIRNQVLDSLGLTPEDLLHFVEVHGTDVDYMRSLWTEVDSLLDLRRRPEAFREGGDPS